ncbi:MAG: HlyD family efflux transporter periplasmic adaptor subunit [Ruminococcus sp.]|nr:HlyD family efflux transporter periplasmic adaptor subunit [Ruminococcus sp.]
MHFAKPEGSLMVKILRNTVLVLFLVIIVSIVYNFRNTESDTECALMSEATASVEFRGVFIRDEKPVSYSGNGTLSYKVADGGKLGDGSIIAEVYPDDSQIGRNREIEKLTRELAILEKIQNPGTLESAQPSIVSESIEASYRNFIYCRDMNDHESLGSAAESLLVQMSTYQLITDEVDNFDQQIADIRTRIMQLRQAGVKPRESIKSDTPAYFVSYCDGYEDTFTSDKLDSITIAQLNDVSDRKLESDTIVGKLVDGYRWHIAGIVDNSRKEYAAGDYVKLRFESSSDKFSAQIVAVRDEGDPSESIVILACEQFNGDLVQHRTEIVELIKGDYRGLQIPRDAIRFSNVKEKTDDGGETDVSYKGVYVRKGEQIEFKKIDVIYEGSDYVLSAVHEADSSYVALYDDIMMDHN